MIAVDERSRHEEVWLLLPWLANGRLSTAEREMAEEHVRRCAGCEQELAAQQLMCSAFTEPDRVTYAPGPSFRKLLARIDADSSASDSAQLQTPASQQGATAGAADVTAGRSGHGSLWRPPGLAWAASFLLLVGITGMMFTAYHWSQPAYRTHTDGPAFAPNVLHIAVDRSVAIGQVEELLRKGGARIVEGPDTTGILGVTPVGVVTGQTSVSSVGEQLRALSARLRSDPRVLWIQPLADDHTPAEQRAPDAREH